MTDSPIRQRPRFLARVGRLPSWSLVAAGILLGGLLGGAYGLLTPVTYTATSYLVAVPTAKSTPEAAQGFAQAYGRVATQLAVLGDAQVWADVPARTLQDRVRATTSPDAPMVAVSATSSRPGVAVDMANAVSRALTQHAEHSKDSTQVRLMPFSRAVEPSEATSATTAVTTLVGVGAGGLLGGLALLTRPRRTGQDEASVPGPSVPGPATAAAVSGQR